MIMSDNKKKAVTLIMGKLGKGPEESEQVPMKDNAEQDSNMPLESAADELLQAIEQKSSKGIVEAIKSMLELLESEKQEPLPEQPLP